MIRRTAALAFAGAALAVIGAGPALACGGMVSPDGATELARFETLLVHDGATQQILTSVAYETSREYGSGTEADEGFAWLMPLPSPPEVGAGDAAAIRSARSMTAPPPRDEHVPPVMPLLCACGAADQGPGATGVDVLGRTVVEGLEFVTLGGERAGEMAAWMREEGFTFHDRQEPVLQGYLDRGWVVVAARILPGAEPTGELTTVRFRFDTAEPVYPLAIAGADHGGPPVRMSLYVATPYRPESATLPQTVVRPDDYADFPQPSDELQLRYSAPLEGYRAGILEGATDLPDGAWLSWYEASFDPETLDQDLRLDRATDQEAVDYEPLLAAYASARRWAYVGR
ncbi:MAG: DUF2330 domain-containing protein, partial [Actinomycetota bacterium]|nr:DUF2330 domain-containing protein [Actinomycetota bacterium]